ncbi:unnamed protein product [Brassicogethes aeneus]|uniref:Uncharacterized protein n=1 Tax=Brassicogethes aeneus TaxID=1431903 RepID=A0A9P0B9X7_BRAAE|nr:unnamed protein product [Brassicogethes aeneus]
MLCGRNRILLKKVRCASTYVLPFEEIPSPRGLPLVGTTLALLAAGSTPKLHKYVDKRHKKFGSIFKEKIGPIDCVFISDPDEMRSVFAQEGKFPIHILPESWTVYNELHGCSRGLFFMNGEEWLYFRRIMNKLLLKGDLTWIDQACEEVSNIIVDKIKYNKVECQEYKTLEADLYKWSLDVIVCVLLGVDVYRSASKSLDKLVKQASKTVHLVFETSAKLSLIPARLAAKYRIPAWKRFEKSVDSALMIANELVTHLLDNYPHGDGLLHKMQQEEIKKSELIRIVCDLILAAGDTTAYSMQWILYLIAKNPVIQNNLRHNLQNNSSTLQKNILKESLRLYPVAPFLTRYLPQEATVNGYRISAGTLLIFSIYTSGRDTNYFKNPEEFNPDRWLRKGTNLAAKATLPFAMGVRSCIGKKIAESQIQLTLSKLVKNFDIELCNKKDVEVVLKMVAVPSHPIRLKFNNI